MTVTESYSVLGLDEEASMTEVKSSFRSKAMECHPDQAKSLNQGEAKRKFIKLKEAYDKIKSIKKNENVRGSEPKRKDVRRETRGSESTDKGKDRNDEWEEFKDDPEGFLKEVETFVRELVIATLKGAVSSFPVFAVCVFVIVAFTRASSEYADISSPTVVAGGLFVAILFSLPFSFLFPAISYMFANLTSSTFFSPMSPKYLGKPYKDNYEYRMYITRLILYFVYLVAILMAAFAIYEYATYEPIQL